MGYFIIILIFIFFLGTATGQESLSNVLDRYNSHSVSYISVEELVMLQKTDKVIILDVREKTEFEVSHISSDHKQLQNLNKDSLLIIACSIGIRSDKIGEKLKKAGFINVKNLYGGIFEGKNKGFHVIDSTGQKTENVHVFSKRWSKWLRSGNP